MNLLPQNTRFQEHCRSIFLFCFVPFFFYHETHETLEREIKIIVSPSYFRAFRVFRGLNFLPQNTRFQEHCHSIFLFYRVFLFLPRNTRNTRKGNKNHCISLLFSCLSCISWFKFFTTKHTFSRALPFYLPLLSCISFFTTKHTKYSKGE
ncbi:hypothetical protein CHISP_1213 [Chitinispirillum alkaliphilum]|nr:hypothetical protein CHISP_1213 [Chitinispirillum alkaliphilum]